MTEGLREEDAPSNPMDLFESWIAYAEELKFHNANAMTVATVDSNLAPSVLTGRSEYLSGPQIPICKDMGLRNGPGTCHPK